MREDFGFSVRIVAQIGFLLVNARQTIDKTFTVVIYLGFDTGQRIEVEAREITGNTAMCGGNGNNNFNWKIPFKMITAI